MNGKERVLKTIAHEEPDRVPVGEWGIDHDHVSRILGRHTFWRNRKDTTLALWENRRDEVVEADKRDYAELIETLDYDVVPVGLVPSKDHKCEDPPKEVSEGVWEDSRGRTYRYAASNDSIMRVGSGPPPKEELTDEDIEAVGERLLNIDESRFELVDYIADRFAETRAIVFRELDTYSGLLGPFGGDEAHRLMMTAMAPDEIRKLHDVVVEYNRLLMERCAKKGVLIAMQSKDWGTNTGPMMRPATIKDLFMPVSERVADHARRLGMIPFIHSCGQIWDVLDFLVEAGFQGYQSIQASAGMDWAEVKAKYGNKLTLWAGVQCETLIEGTLEQVEEEVTAALKTLMPGGGFIFGSTNSVQFGAKTENYLRALELVREHGRYD